MSLRHPVSVYMELYICIYVFVHNIYMYVYIYIINGYQACCRVLQCVAVCCSVLQCVAVCCSVLQCIYLYKQWLSGVHQSVYDVYSLCVIERYTHTHE